MLKTVLVAFDGSEQSRKAFEFGLDVAAKFSARLVVVGVIRLPEPAVEAEVEGMLDRGKEHFAEAFAALETEASRRQVTFGYRVAVGHPAEQIVREAEDIHADLIVMGRRGMTRVTRWVLGSVSERVLRYAHCPVTVIK
jgi:nucleotide-binding universal stress UspA family protein